MVNDVHVRYEDNILDPENPFAVGITIEKLAMESANENWVGIFVCMCIHLLFTLGKCIVCPK